MSGCASRAEDVLPAFRLAVKLFEEFLSVVPDRPEWVEARGMLLSGRCTVLSDHGGFVVRAREVPLAAVAGTPQIETIRRAMDDLPDTVSLVAQLDNADLVARAAPRLSRHEAVIHALPADVTHGLFEMAQDSFTVAQGSFTVAQGFSPAIRLLEPDDAGLFDDLPDALRDELRIAVRSSPIAAAFADGRPVSFAYPLWPTETLWDMSIDTLESHRRRGYAAQAARALIVHMARDGRLPVWGAVEGNIASLRLAVKLGFQPVATIVEFEGPACLWNRTS